MQPQSPRRLLGKARPAGTAVASRTPGLGKEVASSYVVQPSGIAVDAHSSAAAASASPDSHVFVAVVYAREGRQEVVAGGTVDRLPCWASQEQPGRAQ